MKKVFTLITIILTSVTMMAQQASWEKGYFTDEFGDQDRSLPFYSLQLDASDDGFIYVRVSPCLGFEFYRHTFTMYHLASIKAKLQNGEVINFPFIEIDDSRYQIDPGYFEVMANVFSEGYFTLLFTYENLSGETKDRVTVRVKKLTRSLPTVLERLGMYY